jgi:hypothetical protein
VGKIKHLEKIGKIQVLLDDTGDRELARKAGDANFRGSRTNLWNRPCD